MQDFRALIEDTRKLFKDPNCPRRYHKKIDDIGLNLESTAEQIYEFISDNREMIEMKRESWYGYGFFLIDYCSDNIYYKSINKILALFDILNEQLSVTQ
jgi:hypothetical protein